jgi:6-pyruvoyltetrahydropterin/6-carboxytetrahydropterin synthase
MFTIGVRASYEAAHFLRNYEGVCARMHGHRYEVEAVLAFHEVDDSGLAYDFTDADRHLGEIAAELDHRNLNELDAFRDVETTAENQARHIYRELERRLGPVGANLQHVRVWETARHWAQYSGRPVPL